MRFIAAIAAALLPRYYWSRLDTFVPVSRAAPVSAIATILLAAAIAIPAYLRYVEEGAGTAVDLMLQATGWRRASGAIPSEDVAVGSWTASYLSSLNFLFTPVGLLSMYLAASGYFRAVSAYVDDARGDPILTVIDRIVRRARGNASANRTLRERERLEGPEVPDHLVTGRAAGFPDADFVVVASRRKAEWRPGAFVITSDKWYRLGTPVERQMPGGLRTLYPLTELTDHEVLRRGIPYELPPLSGSLSKSV